MLSCICKSIKIINILKVKFSAFCGDCINFCVQDILALTNGGAVREYTEIRGVLLISVFSLAQIRFLLKGVSHEN